MGESNRATDVSSTLYDIAVTFHSATNLAIGDLFSGSSDPYFEAEFSVPSHPHHPHAHPPPTLMYRSKTVYSTRNPQWNEQWLIGGVPNAGFALRIKLFDEDQSNKGNDRLGMTELVVSEVPSMRVDPGLVVEQSSEKKYVLKVKKRRANQRAYVSTYCFQLFGQKSLKKARGRFEVSLEMVKKSSCKCLCVKGPMRWIVHHSPTIGRLAGVRDTDEGDDRQKSNSKVGRYTFQANRLQLLGTPPPELRFLYVEYRPLITMLFSGKGIRGWILSRTLIHQYKSIYRYNQAIEMGYCDVEVERDSETDKAVQIGEETHEQKDSSKDLSKESHYRAVELSNDAGAQQFLQMVKYDDGYGEDDSLAGRLFTYVITLQGEWRFTETGPEWAIQHISKHSMHSLLAKEITFSGEFFVRKLQKNGDMHRPNTRNRFHDAKPDSQHQRRNPADYVLVIDNDSGTYRPDKTGLGLLEAYLSANLRGLHVRAMSCDDEQLQQWKKDQKPKDTTSQRKFKQKEQGIGMLRRADSSVSSVNESDIGELS